MKRPHITVVNYYYILPCNNGGKLATRDFYKALSEWFDITIVCFVGSGHTCVSSLSISPHLKIVPLALPERLMELDENIQCEFGVSRRCEPTFVTSVIRNAHQCQELVSKLCDLSADSSVIITEHTYAYRLVKAVADKRDDLLIWYRAQNVEYDYKRNTWGVYQVPERAYHEVFEIEQECCSGCQLILTITEGDAQRFQELYKTPEQKLLNISAGYDAGNMKCILPDKRKQETSVSALYISSSAQVAVDAAYKIAETAKSFPQVTFYIVGAVGGKLITNDFPGNVIVCGLVSEETKYKLLTSCDFALNPIVGGSGLNIKMLEYFASGIPVICTEFGARGIEVADGENCILVQKDALADAIRRFCALDLHGRSRLAANAYSLYLQKYTWRNSARRVVEALDDRFSDLSKSAVSETDTKLFDFHEMPSFFPTGRIYIYGAGEWGAACLKTLQGHGIIPVAFLDNDKNKQGKKVNNVMVMPPNSEEIGDRNVTVVLALVDWEEVLESLFVRGTDPEHIVVSLYGNKLFRLSDGTGCIPYFVDFNKIQRKVHSLCELFLKPSMQ